MGAALSSQECAQRRCGEGPGGGAQLLFPATPGARALPVPGPLSCQSLRAGFLWNVWAFRVYPYSKPRRETGTGCPKHQGLRLQFCWKAKLGNVPALEAVRRLGMNLDCSGAGRGGQKHRCRWGWEVLLG